MRFMVGRAYCLDGGTGFFDDFPRCRMKKDGKNSFWQTPAKLKQTFNFKKVFGTPPAWAA